MYLLLDTGKKSYKDPSCAIDFKFSSSLVRNGMSKTMESLRYYLIYTTFLEPIKVTESTLLIYDLKQPIFYS